LSDDLNNGLNDDLNESRRKNDPAADDRLTRPVINQATVPDKRLAQFQGQVTQIPGISGVNLSYLPGDIVDNDYQLITLLGRGGMGAVFSCRHLTLDREYAIKLLSAQQLSKEAWVRFQSEARALARLNHPNIVSIYNMGIDKQQCPYYVMDLLVGHPLDELIHQNGMLDEKKVLDIFIQVAGALNSAHNQGIVHRDVKPSNVMVTDQREHGKPLVKLVDFGIARVSKQDLTSQSQTATGLIFGTPYYMSPEQCQGEKVDARSDIYSFGCALYEALTGRPPFVGDSAFHTFMMHQSEEAPPMVGKAGSTIAPELVATVDRMLRKKPADRYQTMAQVEQDLKRIREGKSIGGQIRTEMRPAPPPSVETTPANQISEADQNRRLPLKAIGLSLAALSLLAGVPASYFLLSGAHSGNHYSVKNSQSESKDKFASNTGKQPSTPTAGESNQPRHQSSDDDIPDISKMILSSGTSLLQPSELLRKFGASDAEFADVDTDKLTNVEHFRKKAADRFAAYLQNPQWRSQKFRRGDSFYFPEDVTLGTIQIGNGKLRPAKGIVFAPINEKAFLYMTTSTQHYPELLNKFGADDLTGLDLNVRGPEKVLPMIKSWHRLVELDFFNSILKAMPNESETWDESELSDNYLPLVGQLSGLTTIGFCTPTTGPAIVNSAFFKRIHGLKLKRIVDFDPLLKALPDRDNLHELWLIHQDTNDAQLEYLTKMKNLEKLTIRRAYLTLDSVKYFQKMHALKSLRLDRNDWTAAQKADFQRQLPKVKVSFEPVMETTYWQL
jgi:serine/threonine protein kinase